MAFSRSDTPVSGIRIGNLASAISAADVLKTVLIVDDEVRIRRVARRVLLRAGYQTLEAESGKTGLEVFEANADKLLAVILDVDLTDMNGLDLARVMREAHPGVKLIISTGELSLEVPEGVYFLRKPYRSSELIEMLANKPQLAPPVAC